MSDLFSCNRPAIEELLPDLFLLANFVETQPLLAKVKEISKVAPFRQMKTPGGRLMEVEMTNCGDFGWVSSTAGYSYHPLDPNSNNRWPPMPTSFLQLAQKAAVFAGFKGFTPDSCLLNRYQIGTKLGSHQDKDEKCFDWPIVSVSIGLPAVFQVFGLQRSGKALNINLYDGDVVVWGGKSRLYYHAVKSIKAQPQTPNLTWRINLTFRKSN